MKLVVLDGYTLNPGDLSWDKLKSVAEVEIFDRTPPEEVISRAKDAPLILTNKVKLPAATIEALPELRYIGVLATGHDVVDSTAAKARGIPVCNVPGYGTASVTQHVTALLLEMTNGTGRYGLAAQKKWSQSSDFCFYEQPLMELEGKTLGILGYGAIGRAVAGVGRALGMEIIVHSRSPVVEFDVTTVDLPTLFQKSDVLTLHCPLTSNTQQIVNAERLKTMKPTAFVINTARGSLIDEAALADALNRGEIAGAGLDVLSAEPPPSSNPLLQAKNCLLTPHVAWATKEARQRLMDQVVANVEAFLAGKPIHDVTHTLPKFSLGHLSTKIS
jgi:glycerate dehydrogenase